MLNKLKKIPGKWLFLIIIVFIYLLLLVIDVNLFLKSVDFFNEIILKIIFVMILVFVLMSLTNYLITPKSIIKHFKEKGIKKWFYVIIGGILSTGPVYMWYPLLADLKEKGLDYGLISCFLYNRAIKIPLIPFILLYFGLKYVIVLTFVMIFISIIQGKIINKFMEV